MSTIDEQDFDEKRLARRQRRKKSQLIAYIILAVLVVAVIGAGAFGVISIKRAFDGRNEQIASEEEQEAQQQEVLQGAAIETPETDTAEEQPMTQDELLDEVVNTCIDEMPLEDKVAGLFMITPEQLTGVDTVVKAGSGTQDALSTYAVGGLVYSAKNIKSADQIQEMLSSTASMSKYPVFTAVFENGQSERAVSSTIGIDGITDAVDSDSAYNSATAIGNALFKCGFNLDFAPKLDITESGDYGTDIDAVKNITASFSAALSETGTSACIYSFPADADTKSGMAIVETTQEELATNEYSVFKNVIDNGSVSAIQMSNACFSGLTDDNIPASLASDIIGNELRGVLGYDGIVITGALNDGAITEYYTPEEAAINAIKAGADMIYLPEDFDAAYNGLLSAAQNGQISEERINESLRRIFRVKFADRVNQVTG